MVLTTNITKLKIVNNNITIDYTHSRGYSIIVPLYRYEMYTVDSTRKMLIDAVKQIPVRVIIGGWSSLDKRPRAEIMTAIDEMRNAGIEILHYNPTRKLYDDAGNKYPCCECCDEIESVKTRLKEIDTYWPGDGIFFDNGPFSAEPSNIAFYKELYDYTQENHGPRTTVFNPSHHYKLDISEYMKWTNFNMMDFESTYTNWKKALTDGTLETNTNVWKNAGYLPKRFSMIVEKVDTIEEAKDIINTAATMNFGSFYITDKSYEEFPSYFVELVEYISKINSQ